MVIYDCYKIRSEYLMNEFDIYSSYFTVLMMLLNIEEQINNYDTIYRDVQIEVNIFQ